MRRYLTYNEEITFELTPAMGELYPHAFFHDFETKELDCSSLMNYDEFMYLCSFLRGVIYVTHSRRKLLHRLRMTTDTRLEKWYKFNARRLPGIHWCNSYEEYRLVRELNMGEYVPCQVVCSLSGEVIAVFAWHMEPLYTMAGDITERHSLLGRYTALSTIIPCPRKATVKQEKYIKDYMMPNSIIKAITAFINLYKSSSLPPKPNEHRGNELRPLSLRQQATVMILAEAEYPIVTILHDVGVSLGYIRLQQR